MQNNVIVLVIPKEVLRLYSYDVSWPVSPIVTVVTSSHFRAKQLQNQVDWNISGRSWKHLVWKMERLPNLLIHSFGWAISHRGLKRIWRPWVSRYAVILCNKINNLASSQRNMCYKLCCIVKLGQFLRTNNYSLRIPAIHEVQKQLCFTFCLIFF